MASTNPPTSAQQTLSPNAKSEYLKRQTGRITTLSSHLFPPPATPALMDSDEDAYFQEFHLHRSRSLVFFNYLENSCFDGDQAKFENLIISILEYISDTSVHTHDHSLLTDPEAVITDADIPMIQRFVQNVPVSQASKVLKARDNLHKHAKDYRGLNHSQPDVRDRVKVAVSTFNNMLPKPRKPEDLVVFEDALLTLLPMRIIDDNHALPDAVFVEFFKAFLNVDEDSLAPFLTLHSSTFIILGQNVPKLTPTSRAAPLLLGYLDTDIGLHVRSLHGSLPLLHQSDVERYIPLQSVDPTRSSKLLAYMKRFIHHFNEVLFCPSYSSYDSAPLVVVSFCINMQPPPLPFQQLVVDLLTQFAEDEQDRPWITHRRLQDMLLPYYSASFVRNVLNAPPPRSQSSQPQPNAPAPPSNAVASSSKSAAPHVNSASTSKSTSGGDPSSASAAALKSSPAPTPQSTSGGDPSSTSAGQATPKPPTSKPALASSSLKRLTPPAPLTDQPANKKPKGNSSSSTAVNKHVTTGGSTSTGLSSATKPKKTGTTPSGSSSSTKKEASSASGSQQVDESLPPRKSVERTRYGEETDEDEDKE